VTFGGCLERYRVKVITLAISRVCLKAPSS
jgi:hypothetical protein